MKLTNRVRFDNQTNYSLYDDADDFLGIVFLSGNKVQFQYKGWTLGMGTVDDESQLLELVKKKLHVANLIKDGTKYRFIKLTQTHVTDVRQTPWGRLNLTQFAAECLGVAQDPKTIGQLVKELE